MHRKSACGAAMLAALIVATVGGSTPAAASISYNYKQDWMFDSDTGLYWQVLQIPANTFVPSSGRIAGFGDLTTLGMDAGLAPNGSFIVNNQQTGPYSVATANLLSFFQSDTPAPQPTLQRELLVSAVYDYAPTDPPPDSFEYAILDYAPTSNAPTTDWRFSGNTTIGSYGPGFPCEPAPGGVCPPTEPAFVVSTMQPTPLPPGIWLLLSGIASLAYFRVARQRTSNIR